MTDANTQPKEQIHWLKRYIDPSSPNGLRRTALYAGALLLLIVFGVLLETVKHTAHGALLDHTMIPILVLVLALDGVIVEVVKKLVARNRPTDFTMLVHESSFSFPSGHTMAATLGWGIVAYFIARSCRSRSLRWLTVIVYAFLVLLVGMSRVYLGAHYPTDVLGSILLGGGILALITAWLADHHKNLPGEVFSNTVTKCFALAFALLLVATLVVPSLFG
jgi:membrane-associated phospholipid phosphatase